MSPIKAHAYFAWIASFLLLTAAVGCGSSTPNTRTAFNAENRKHTETWIPLEHKTAAQENANACAECHGSDLSGGVSGVSCSQCHLGGPASVHPLDWAGNALVTKHGEYVATVRSYASCATAVCHGVRLEGVAGSGHACSRCH